MLSQNDACPVILRGASGSESPRVSMPVILRAARRHRRIHGGCRSMQCLCGCCDFAQYDTGRAVRSMTL